MKLLKNSLVVALLGVALVATGCANLTPTTGPNLASSTSNTQPLDSDSKVSGQFVMTGIALSYATAYTVTLTIGAMTATAAAASTAIATSTITSAGVPQINAQTLYLVMLNNQKVQTLYRKIIRKELKGEAKDKIKQYVSEKLDLSWWERYTKGTKTIQAYIPDGVTGSTSGTVSWGEKICVTDLQGGYNVSEYRGQWWAKVGSSWEQITANCIQMWW